MLEVFRADHARVRSRGVLARGRFWLRMFADVVVASCAERTASRRRHQERRTSMRISSLLGDLRRDFRLALRRLGQRRGWALAASGTLALGLAASTLAGVIGRDVLLRPLPFPQADRLVRIIEISDDGRRWWPSFPNASDWREQARVFDGVGIADVPRVEPVRLDAGAVRVSVSRAARGLFETLEVRPIAGRLFSARENRPGGEPAAIISERFWRGVCAGRSLDGLTVEIGGVRYAVVGVLPSSFRFLGEGAAWTQPADIYEAALDRLRAAPGIIAAGMTSILPSASSAYTAPTQRDGQSRSIFAGYRIVDAGYFAAMGIPRLQGTDSLQNGGAMVDRVVGRSLWNSESPLGGSVWNSFSAQILTVTGVVDTVREWNQAEDAIGAVYVDYHHRPDRIRSMHLVVRFAGAEATAANTVRRTLTSVDALVPVSIDALENVATESLGGRRLLLLLASGFGAAALLLAAAGVYAMSRFGVERQARENAIRLALGARPGALRGRVILHGLVPAGSGILLAGMFVGPLGRALVAQLFHVRPIDPAALASAATAALAATVLATLLPARRAARIDPAEVLRQE